MNGDVCKDAKNAFGKRVLHWNTPFHFCFYETKVSELAHVLFLNRRSGDTQPAHYSGREFIPRRA